jgi:hypothetical protein
VRLLAILVTLGLAAHEVAAQSIQVRVRDATTQRIQFDPNKRPHDMPELKETERAICVSDFGINVRLNFTPTHRQTAGAWEASIRINDATIDVTLENRIYVPVDASTELRAHEEGHRQISEIVYRDARDAARAEGRRLASRIWKGEGATKADATADAVRKFTDELTSAYLKRVAGKADALHKFYDELTDHGQKLEPAVAEAIRLSIERWRREQADSR